MNFRQITGLGEIAERYDAVLCDVWGVLHNGREAFAPASDALVAFRRRGGTVVLLTNAPRPNAPIREQVLQFGVSPDAFDAIVTSGDVTVSLIAERIAQKVHYIGPERDLGILDAAAAQAGGQPRRVGLAEADYVLCTGLFNDDDETPEDYEASLLEIARRRLPFVCANPDIIVHRGAKLIYCAGALAQRVAELGGATIYAGKPHTPIYAAALNAASRAARRPLAVSRVLAIGDGMRTDIAGAVGQGLDALFITAGIHTHEIHGEDGAEAAALRRLFVREGAWPYATARMLAP